MAVVKRIRSRGATITVEANAEVLFMPRGDIHNWTNRFTGRIRSKTIFAAPENKRPRWQHYGKPLKSTIVSARPRFWGNGRDRQRVYAAVGAKADHSAYVDQGTGIYAGRGPYPAKILPPWTRGSASLYEHTWRPLGPGTRRVSQVMIKGQRGQFFFDKGLRLAFQSMRLRSAQVPGSAKISDVLASVPSAVENFLGNTPDSPAFRASLTEWRKWRDDAWEAHEGLGRGGGIGSAAQARFRAQAEAAREARLAAQGKGRAAYLASKAAADARAKAQRDRLRAQREAKALGEKRERERQAQIAAQASQKKARLAAVAFAQKQTAKGATGVTGGWLGDYSGFRVRWTSRDGKAHERVFKV